MTSAMPRPPILWLLPSKPAHQYQKFPAYGGGLYYVRSQFGRVLYVGMTSQSFRDRWADHHRLGQAIAANADVSFWYLPDCSARQLLEIEHSEIQRLNPSWNGTPAPWPAPLWIWDLLGAIRSLPVLLALVAAAAWLWHQPQGPAPNQLHHTPGDRR
jgi:hypothetical protein